MVEAPNLHGMVPTSTANVHKAFDIILMLWIDRWNHSHAVIASLLGPDLERSRGTNDIMMEWLRLQTNMEWFPLPLHTYKRCFTSFLCYGQIDGATIMPLPPVFLAQIWGVRQNRVMKQGLKNDVMVEWLRLQTHMEWFPLPLHTYT